MEPFHLNFFENVALVQFDHRVLATTTVSLATALVLQAKSSPIWALLPPQLKAAYMGLLAVAWGQVSTNISFYTNKCIFN